MFLKLLKISDEYKTIREIHFKKGINLIVDETINVGDKTTGNNVGKTTVLKLIDFCLGADPKIVYVDPESKKDVYVLVKNFLTDNNVVITLVLKHDLDIEDSEEIVIERNFLTYKNKIQRINGEKLNNDEFELKLLDLIIPEQKLDKPTFRQIISHNIRYKDESINNTLNILDKYAKDSEYEALYLFLFGCSFGYDSKKQEILEKIRQEESYKKRIEKDQTKSAYNTALVLIDDDIKELNEKKASFNLNKDFELDLDSLNKIKYEINKTSSEISKLSIRKDLIIEAEKELSSKKSEIDLQQLKLIYKQATDKIDGIQKTFDDLVNYHNSMIVEKVKFIKKDLPELEREIKSKKFYLKSKLNEELTLSSKILKGNSFLELEDLIIRLNEKFKEKGEYETIIGQLNEAENNIDKYNEKLDKINEGLFSDEFIEVLQDKINKFNKHFAFISDQLYGEKYAIKYDIHKNKKGQKLYKFSSFNTNMSSGKKQGEIICFDIAYTLFADEQNISCLHFLLNDKKELMHDNQLVRISEFISKNNIQFVASILKDKLPDELNDDKYFSVQLSQKDKLFRIESE